MAVKLGAEDYRVLVEILRDLEAFRSVEGRWALVEMALEGNPRAPHVLGQLNLDLSRQAAAGMVIKRLADFGQVAYGREALGLLLNHIEPLVSDQQQPIIRDVLKRYGLEAEAPPKPLPEWRDARSVEAVKERIIGENTLRHVNVLEKALAVETRPFVVRRRRHARMVRAQTGSHRCLVASAPRCKCEHATTLQVWGSLGVLTLLNELHEGALGRLEHPMRENGWLAGCAA